MAQQDFTNTRVVILGLARQGTAAACFFVQQGAQVTISDAAAAATASLNVAFIGSALPLAR